MNKFLNNHGTAILTGVGVVGVLGTAALAIQATPKAQERLKDAEKAKGSKLSKWEIFLNGSIPYIPTAIMATATITSILISHQLDHRKQVELASAYTALAGSFVTYKEKVKEKVDEETYKEISYEYTKEKLRRAARPPKPTSGLCTFYDDHSHRYFEMSLETFKNSEHMINKIFAQDNYVSINQLYELWGLEPTTDGDLFGWSYARAHEFYGCGWIDLDFEKCILDDGMEVYVIDLPFPPVPGYEDV